MATDYQQLVRRRDGKFRRIVCHTLSTNFRASTKIVEERLPDTLRDSYVVVENRFLGINASDINFTNGRYDPSAKPPFPCGFESVGEVAAVGSKVKKFRVGDAVACASVYGAFSELLIVHEKGLVRVPAVSASVLPMLVCGQTASVALSEVGDMASGETVLVTAAAGGTGQFAVQLAKLAGNRVIGTCSSEEKAEHLRSLGCDRVINYRTEDVFRVLREEYPKGVDLVFESVGGSLFKAALDNLAPKGRLLVIGAVSGYQDDTAWKQNKKDGGGGGMPLQTKLLAKSASVRGFFLNLHNDKLPVHAKKLATLLEAGLLDPGVDPTPFEGLAAVADALDALYARKNIGKLVVSLPPPLLPPPTSRL